MMFPMSGGYAWQYVMWVEVHRAAVEVVGVLASVVGVAVTTNRMCTVAPPALFNLRNRSVTSDQQWTRNEIDVSSTLMVCIVHELMDV